MKGGIILEELEVERENDLTQKRYEGKLTPEQHTRIEQAINSGEEITDELVKEIALMEDKGK